VPLYLIGNTDEAIVIDAALPPEVYQDLAAEHGWTITRVFDTHVHADHLSRSRLLAEQTGATLHMPEQDRVSYPFAPIGDGDALSIGSSRLTPVRTPGHTLESTSYLLDDRALFTGDTLFLAGVGRPDLEASPEQARERARLLHASLQRLMALPPETVILPGHTSEPAPFDGQPISATLADVINRVPMVGMSESAFLEAILARIPPTPPNHAQIVALNEAGELPDGIPRSLRREPTAVPSPSVTTPAIRLGLLENWQQFSLLVLINAFVGGMVGLERTVVPLLAEQEFGLASRTIALSFIVSFGIVKALPISSPDASLIASGASRSSLPGGSLAYRCRSSSCWRRAGTGSFWPTCSSGSTRASVGRRRSS
jgi:glyoxylase-like metal-dependent hydrolase (beta-lactamase superfamily II)